METIISFDFGTKSIGSAVGNSFLQSAKPLWAVKVFNNEVKWQMIDEMVKEWQPDFFVVGLPLTVQGEMLQVSFLAKKFAKNLKTRFNKKVYLVDERFSSTSAREELFNVGGVKKLQKGNIDCESACIILETYFSSGAIDEIV